jgi:dTDP-glucose 4,6-dehydratase
VDAILKVIMNGRPGEIYNITSSHEISNIELIGKIKNLLYDNIKSDIKLQVQHVQDRPGHDGRYSMDCSKIKRDLGWEPAHSFDYALGQTIKWYIDNDWWWAPLLTQEILGPPTWQSK